MRRSTAARSFRSSRVSPARTRARTGCTSILPGRCLRGRSSSRASSPAARPEDDRRRLPRARLHRRAVLRPGRLLRRRVDLMGAERADRFYDARQDLARRTSRTAASISLQVSSTTVLERVGEFLDGRPAAKPLLLYVNLVDTHYPYTHREIEDLLGIGPMARDAIRADNAKAVFRAYANSAANVDRAVERLVEKRREHFPAEESAILVTADHGESFYEEGTLGHGQLPARAETQVPLIVSGIGGKLAGADRDLGPASPARREPVPPARRSGARRGAGRRSGAPRLPVPRPARGAEADRGRTLDGPLAYDFRTGAAWQSGPADDARRPAPVQSEPPSSSSGPGRRCKSGRCATPRRRSAARPHRLFPGGVAAARAAPRCRPTRAARSRRPGRSRERRLREPAEQRLLQHRSARRAQPAAVHDPHRSASLLDCPRRAARRCTLLARPPPTAGRGDRRSGRTRCLRRGGSSGGGDPRWPRGPRRARRRASRRTSYRRRRRRERLGERAVRELRERRGRHQRARRSRRAARGRRRPRRGTREPRSARCVKACADLARAADGARGEPDALAERALRARRGPLAGREVGARQIPEPAEEPARRTPHRERAAAAQQQHRHTLDRARRGLLGLHGEPSASPPRARHNPATRGTGGTAARGACTRRAPSSISAWLKSPARRPGDERSPRCARARPRARARARPASMPRSRASTRATLPSTSGAARRTRSTRLRRRCSGRRPAASRSSRAVARQRAADARATARAARCRLRARE